MADYEALDISAHYNARADVLGEDSGFEPGAQNLRGLPFQVGDGADPAADCLISLDGKSGGVTIPIGKPAHRVVIAHRMMESVLHSGGPLGAAVGDYVLRLAGGAEVRVPLRERFEIAPLQNLQSVPGVPGSPFLAVPDSTAGLMPRHEGEWDLMGRRQMEGIQEWPRWFYLWAWANPEPGSVVESLEIVPAGPELRPGRHHAQPPRRASLRKAGPPSGPHCAQGPGRRGQAIRHRRERRPRRRHVRLPAAAVPGRRVPGWRS